MIDLFPPLPPLPEEVPIRSGRRPSALPPAPASPGGAAGRAEVAAQVGAPGQGAKTILQPLSSITTSAAPREEVKAPRRRAAERAIAKEWLAYCRALLRGEHPAAPDRRQLPFPEHEEGV